MIGFPTARHFGLRDFARGDRIFVAAAGGAPLGFGHLFDGPGRYGGPFTFAAMLIVTGAAGLVSLGRYRTLTAEG